MGDHIITGVDFKEGKVVFSLQDGREIGLPLSSFPRLEKASMEELMDFTISPSGYGVHWNQLDEDLSASGMMYS